MEIVVDTTRLYKQASNGKLQVWEISYEDDLITIVWGDDDGLKQVQEEEILDGLAGRSIEEQVLLRVQSRVNKKLDRGYVRDREHAIHNRPVNQMGLKKPMLAKRFDKIKNVNYNGAMSQLKYNGHRCLIHYDGTDLIAYSKGGKPITSITEIFSSVRMSGLTQDFTLDGELYHHGTKLQTISSWVKRRQAMTAKLEYVVYDVIPDDENWFYPERYRYLQSLNYARNFRVAETDSKVEQDRIPMMLQSSIKAGYEGVIIRQDGFSYQDDKRNQALIKVKSWQDDEYKVVGIMPSKEGYAILTCVMNNGVEFDATAPGTMEEKHEIIRNQKDYLGKFVNVRYESFTDAGKPFQPIATGWREPGE